MSQSKCYYRNCQVLLSFISCELYSTCTHAAARFSGLRFGEGEAPHHQFKEGKEFMSYFKVFRSFLGVFPVVQKTLLN